MKSKHLQSDKVRSKKEQKEFLKKLLNVSDMKVGKTWRKKYEGNRKADNNDN